MEPETIAERPRFISAAQRQTERDSEYSRAYSCWIKSLSPAQRMYVEELGLTEKADTSRRTHHFGFNDSCASVAIDPERSDPFKKAMAEVVSELCHWFVMPHGQRGLSMKAIGQRVTMAMWVMRPDIIGNLSLMEIAQLADTSPEVLSRQASAFTKRFGIRGRAQFSDKARKAQRAAKLNSQIPVGEEIHGNN